MSVFALERRRGVEILDDPSVSDDVRERSLRDVIVSNRLLGGLRAARREVNRVVRGGRGLRCRTLLDVGTGLGDLPASIGRDLPDVKIFGLDVSWSIARAARPRLSGAVCGSALALPFRAGSVDVVMCAQLLHHFQSPHLERAIGELDRVARSAVVIADLRRSRLAAAGFWIVSHLLRFHPVTRHDGVVSVLRGFTGPELRALVERVTGVIPTVRHHPGFRLTATWAPRAKA